jgi:O-antigen/teichoic acid export membrane protein
VDTIRRAMVSSRDGTTASDMTERSGRLTAARTVAHGTLWNLAGRLGPMLVAIAATPFLVDALGVDRFGIFSLALSLIGIFGIFDFGFGRAITRLVAERLATGDDAEAAPAVLTGIVLLTLLGALGGGVLALLADAYASRVLVVPDAQRAEVGHALMLLCASAPLVVLNAALWGLLAAYQRFAAANLVNMPIMALYYLGPLAVLPFADSLVAVIGVLVLCRLAMTVAYARIALAAMPALRHARIVPSAIGPLLRFGGWLTVSNLTWPALLYLDRFVIAATISAAATAWYATPFDLILRFSIIPIAVMQSGFPAIASAYRSDPPAAARLFRLGSLAVAASVLPAALIVTLAAQPLLRLWLGAEFAGHAAPVLRLLGVGVLFLCLDNVPTGLLDAIGRPETNARLALASLILYAPLLAGLIALFGIEGAALAWTLRVVASFAVRLVLCGRHYPALAETIARLVPMLAAALLALTVGLYSWPASLAAAALAGMLGWRLALGAEERGYVLARLAAAR